MKAAIMILGTLSTLLAPGVSSALDTSSVAAENYDFAVDAFQSRNYEEAARLLEPMASENPYSGKIWMYLANALYGLEQWEKSADAYDSAAELGYRKSTALYNAACCRALLGQTDRALDTLERSLRGHVNNREQLIRTDTDLDSIRNTKGFQDRILPSVPADISRVDGWGIDLDYLHRRMEETHFDLYRKISREEWRQELDRIRNEVPDSEDHEIIVDLMALFARINDGHTGVAPPMAGSQQAMFEAPGRPDNWHALPMDFYVFADGIYVRSAERTYRDAVGKRVLRVGKVSAEEALERCATVTQRDNTQQIKWIAPRWMSVVEVLQALGIVDDLDHVDIVVADEAGGEEGIRIQPVEFTRDISGRRFADPVSMIEGDVPLYLKDRARHYWFEYLEEEKIVYFFFDSVRDQEGRKTLAEFSEELFGFIDKNEVDALVIDVRLNHGGNNHLVKPMIDAVLRSEKINEQGKLFMVIGRETFSACQNFTNRMQRETNVMFVGEATGSSPNFVGEGNPIWLPYSGITVRGSSLYWQDSTSGDARPWVAPDLVAELTSDDYRQGNDPAMATIRAYIASHRRFLEEHASR